MYPPPRCGGFLLLKLWLLFVPFQMYFCVVNDAHLLVVSHRCRQSVRIDSGMVVDEPDEPISTVLQERKLRRGQPDNPTPTLLSVLSQVYITLNHSGQSKLYLSSCQVFIKGVSRAVRLFHWTTCQIRSACRLLRSWD
jgi:hypothetical protein